MPPRKRSANTKSRDNNESPQPSKRVKTSSTTSIPSGKKFVDGDGNPYWELGGRLRRVTVSEFKGSHLINIREHYEKDGKILPGKKGISLSVDQFNNLLSVLPQIDVYLADNDVEVTRPMYGLLNTGDSLGKQKQKGKEKTNEEEEGEEDEEVEGVEERKEKKGRRREDEIKEEETVEGEYEEYEKEEEEEEEDEEEEKEVKPKRKPVQKKAEPKQKKAEPKQKKAEVKARPKKRVFHSDAESD